ncbi:hypothetical protein EYF80_029658 [Liparis tanakae]|uniref:Uncharacterized protein n=1 Tax=Liparis tanakae TaxID=230148 RepID=A0A4Z2H2T6_9TELE|nr:hypothetical protein EYF80_029658 [Liparis tanakae]
MAFNGQLLHILFSTCDGVKGHIAPHSAVCESLALTAEGTRSFLETGHYSVGGVGPRRRRGSPAFVVKAEAVGTGPPRWL